MARAASGGGGILLAYGNTAGDVLNGPAARVHLEAEGVDCRAVAVTDDLASAPAEQADRRRGIAGGLVVFKVAARRRLAGGRRRGRRGGPGHRRPGAPRRPGPPPGPCLLYTTDAADESIG
ncbi:dihydroxyacetone kinase subunit DhaK, partial [Micromonospora sp. DH15]|nr:dihydroxyacetone kinase subunit DhaK [Micromonospora sp. DH15]